MKTTFLLVATAVAISTIRAAEPIPNNLIDYPGFQKIVIDVGPKREAHRLTEKQFLEKMAEPGVVVLDARTASRYAQRHIKGAVNLPFTEFTAGTLSEVIPAKDTLVLIYCNNNFTGDQVAFASKTATASLNLSTFTSLASYGYTNIYELGPLLDVKTTMLPFEGTEVKP
jgi:rhodanese-related sulfurtransferase